MDEQRLDQEIRMAVGRKAARVTPSDQLFQNITGNLSGQEEKGRVSMKKNKLKTMVVVGILCIGSITCYAASKAASYSSSSSHLDDMKTYPTAAEVQKTVGFTPDYVEKFSNGFTFTVATPGDTAAKDEEGNTITKGKQIAFQYSNGKEKEGNILSLNVSNLPDTEEENMKFSKDNYLFVPPTYEVTAEEKALEAAGELYISYGSEEVEHQVIQNVTWKKDGLRYHLMDMGYELPQAELEQMAKEIMGE